MSAIAIVGMGCRFAGAPDLHAFWNLTAEGRDAFGPVPPDRWPAEAFYDTSKRATDKTYAPAGAFIDDVRSFPALWFGIPPRRVEVMDPQQRLSLVLALQAMHDAGYSPGELPRRTGVFMGVTANEFRELVGTRVTAGLMAAGALGDSPADPDQLAKAVQYVVPSRPFSAPGSLSNMVAAAVAQELDLHGPAYTVDAACASGLVAVHDAVAQLRAGLIDAAIAGGVYLQLTPNHYIAFARIGAMSASGVCRPFDHRADGFVQGDGGGTLLLKRLVDAQRDGDRVYAVLRGIAMNNDGRGDGPMAPVLEGQATVIRDAWADADTDTSAVGYIETHGTGTAVGDVIELSGLREALSPAASVALGSAKANVGHTMSAAGIAGIIRATLAIHHQVLPPMAGFEAPKEELELDTSAFHVPTQATPWTADDRLAGVSSFGFGGTNGHVVLASHATAAIAAEPQVELVRLSAGSEAGLGDVASRLAAEVRSAPGLSVAAISRAWAGRPSLDHRAAVAVHDRTSLLTALDALAAGEYPDGAAMGIAPDTAPTLALLFPGQGAQRVGMLAGIGERFQVVADSLAASEQVLADSMAVPLTHLLYPDRRSEPVDSGQASLELTDTAHCQPALVAIGLALTHLLERVGVRPSVVAGHSLGEFNAAVVGGVVSGEDALRFAARRGRAMAGVAGDPGTMAALMTDPSTASELLVDGAVIANENHPQQVVVSGSTEAVAAVVKAAAEAGVEAKPLQVSHGFHSQVFAELDMAPHLHDIPLHDPVLTVASCIADRPYGSSADAAAVFARHARSPVRFEGALRQCAEAGADLFLQVGAGGPLASFARKGVSDARAVLTLGSLDDADGGRAVLQALGWLWVHGVDVDTRPITAHAPIASVPPLVLPTEPYWPVKQAAQKSLVFNAVTAAPRVADAVDGSPVEVAAPTDPEDDGVFGRVAAVVASVSSYPLAALKPTSTLVDDLGFDSLMVSDLATGLADAFPGLGGLPQELWINSPTVDDIVRHVRGGGSGDEARAADGDPLTAFRPVWRPTGLPEGLPRSGALEGLKVLMTGDPDSEIKAALRQAGAQITRRPRQAVDQIVHVCPFTDPAPVHAVLALEAEASDRSGDLIDLLDKQVEFQSTPGLLVVRRDDDPWAEAESAVARTVAREWPHSVSKSLRFVEVRPAFRAARVVQELVSEDRSVDVRWTATGREVLGHQASTLREPQWTPGPEDTVLITGGTHGIGSALAARLATTGARLILVGRSAPGEAASALLGDRAIHVAADVTDRLSLVAALAPHAGITAVVHAAGMLADGPLGHVDPELGARARSIKVDGWLNALTAAGPDVRVAVAIGSWAGRYGSRHQAHYASGNALMSALTEHDTTRVRTVCVEFGPWSDSEMVRSIPLPVQAAMRSEGVDFVSDEAGLDAVWQALQHHRGPVICGRGLPWTTRARTRTERLDVATHPYLADHAIEGVPVLPLAAAADLMAALADFAPPFELRDLKLYQGITVSEPVTIEVSVRGDRAEIRLGDNRQLAYRARIGPAELPDAPQRVEVEGSLQLDRDTFYDAVTFHGPMLQGLVAIDAVGAETLTARVTPGTPRDWVPEGDRAVWAIDPLALDSAFQATAMVAWERYRRAGTPVGLGSWLQIHPLTGQQAHVDVRFDAATSDRVTGSFWFYDAEGTLLAVATDAVADLKQVGVDSDADTVDHYAATPAQIDAGAWGELRDLDMRLEAATALGIRNPYFQVHEGTARNTTVVGGQELVNYSSYNYLGLSGDSRVVDQVTDAVRTYGTSVSASRVASGERPFHNELEAELAAAQGLDDTLVFTAGHMTNVNVVGHVMGPNDLVLHDELIHDSILQGIKLSGAGRRSYRHEDPEHLEQLLRELRPHHDKCLIVVEGVYSMDGDLTDLPAFVKLKERWGCLLMVDEAHSFGVVGPTGRGIGEHYRDQVDPARVDLWMGTLSKSLASCGGWIGGSAAMIRYLRYTAPGFVYSAGITPANGVAALASLRLMLAEPERVSTLQGNAQFFHDELVRQGIDTGPAEGGSAVIPAITGNSMHALYLSQRLQDVGINVQPIVYPAVADDAARLRFFLSSTHTRDQLAQTAARVASTLAQIRLDFPV